MSDLKAIALAARRLRAQKETFLLATVVAVQGSSYRRPGARMLIAGDRRVAGSVSGGCLERELIQRGEWHTRDGRPALLTFDSSGDGDGNSDDADRLVDIRARTGCGGVVEILLERVVPDAEPDPLAAVEAAVATETEVDLLTIFRSTRPELPVGTRRVLPALPDTNPRLVSPTAIPTLTPTAVLTPAPVAALIDRARRELSDGGRPFATVALPDGSVVALAERLRPPPHLFVFGAGPDAVPVVELALTLGWQVAVWDARSRAETRRRFAASAHVHVGPTAGALGRIDACARPMTVVMSHNYEHDRQALAMLLRSRALYIGVLGPRRRTDRLLADLSQSDAALAQAVADARDNTGSRLHAPVGLHLGAETPQEIALSVVAEAQAVLAGASAISLRELSGAHGIHASAAPQPATPAHRAVR
ncbi:MAG TPA: XdhC family protein [Polyangia bacterium]|nr:XdhC family protein [Polyangia bacterium]